MERYLIKVAENRYISELQIVDVFYERKSDGSATMTITLTNSTEPIELHDGAAESLWGYLKDKVSHPKEKPLGEFGQTLFRR